MDSAGYATLIFVFILLLIFGSLALQFRLQTQTRQLASARGTVHVFSMDDFGPTIPTPAHTSPRSRFSLSLSPTHHLRPRTPHRDLLPEDFIVYKATHCRRPLTKTFLAPKKPLENDHHSPFEEAISDRYRSYDS